MEWPVGKIFVLCVLLMSAASAPIHDAAKTGDLDAIKVLVGDGADIDDQDVDGMTALMYAAFIGHHEIVQYLLQNGATIDLQDTFDDTALIKAAVNGHDDIAQYLVENGADIEHKNRDGLTPLMLASLFGHLDTVKYLVEIGAKMDENGLNALFFAIMRGQHEVACYLISMNIDTNVGNFGNIEGKCSWNGTLHDVGSEWYDGDQMLVCEDTCFVVITTVTTTGAPSTTEVTTTGAPSATEEVLVAPAPAGLPKCKGCQDPDVIIQVVQEVNN